MLMHYAISATDDMSVNEIHLQKMMFQIMKIMGFDPEDAGYRPHRYGPYSDLIMECERKLNPMDSCLGGATAWSWMSPRGARSP